MKKVPYPQDVFFQYPVTVFKTSAGDIDLPIFYYDNSLCMAIFMVDIDNAKPLISDDRLEVFRFSGDKAMVAIAFYEYRHTEIGPYNEVGVAIAVAPKGTEKPCLPLLKVIGPLDKNPLGFCVVDLPVTTEAACAAGREVWGLPKFVTPIEFSLQGKAFLGRVADPGQDFPIFTMAGEGRLSVPSPLLDIALYSVREDELLRTLVNTRGGGRTMLGGSIRVQVSADSVHPMAQRLRQLGLHDATPMMISVSHKLQLRLNAGAQVSKH